MDSLPPLRKLQYVVAVARDLHFRKAAERLHVSQPAISRQIREYEEEIGFEILHRDHHFVSLTKAGRAFVSDVEGIVARMEGDFAAAVRRARAISREVPAEYTVGHSPFAPMQIRRIAMDLQREDFRNLPMRLRILPTSELLNAIENEIVQAGITYAPVEHAGVAVIPVSKDHWVAIVPAKGRFSDVAVARVEDFRGEPVISNGADRTHPALFRRLEAECIAKGFPFRAIAEVTSPVEAFDLVASNTGIVFLPSGVCEGLPPGVRAIRIVDISPLEIVLIHRSDSSGFSQEFAERIRAKLTLRGRANDDKYREPLTFPAKRKPPASVSKAKSKRFPNQSAG
jgi:DNA-binding transcriptional LysR family regulator